MTHRISVCSERPAGNAEHGRVTLSNSKLLWVGGMMLTALTGGIITISVEHILVFLVTTGGSLCFGHSLGMHRKLIHNSYQCPKWLEYLMVHLGVIVGLAGPFGMINTHDLRDWAQRQPHCHPFLGHQSHFWKDAWWQLFCDLKLQHPPHIAIESRIANDPVYRFMERTWMWQQLPLAIILFVLGGVPYLVWGVAARVSVSVTGHWLIGYFAHNHGPQTWLVKNASIQGHNIPFTSILTMGECWHNNHHAFPGSAKLGLEKGQWDPGWWMLLVMQKLNLVWDLVLHQQLAKRPELQLNSRESKTYDLVQTTQNSSTN